MINQVDHHACLPVGRSFTSSWW
ncbi:MAG: hypothetical protein ACD_3C00083G0027, partial [uncultured bacterium (gcode 4)]